MTTWGKVCCIFGVHQMSGWRTVKPADGPINERHCKRRGCVYSETKPLKPRRAPTSADTVTGPQ